MSILYKMKALPKRNEDELIYLHPYVVSRGTKRLADWAEEAHDGGTLNKADILGAMKSLEEFIVKSLRNGYQVELDGVGTLAVSLSSRKVTDEKEIRGNSLDVKRVTFRCSKSLKTRLSGASLERSGAAKHDKTTFDFRHAKLMKYLSEHPFINRGTYRILMGCSDRVWRSDCNRYLNEGILKREGKSPLNFYTLAVGSLS